jgi:cadmium resistance protein CadD (predicted permease)
MTILVSVLVVFMVATFVVAVWQERLGWGWWWTVHVGGGFVALIIGFRVLVQRAQDDAERADRELDESDGG